MAERIKTQPASTTTASPAPGAEIVADAYIFGYPLVLLDVIRRVAATVSSPIAGHVPMNQCIRTRPFPDASFTDVVSPNADTLYSAAWIDLSQDPIVLSVPEMTGCYYLFPLLDAWTNVFASPGTRTTGNSKGRFAIVGPAWILSVAEPTSRGSPRTPARSGARLCRQS